MSNLTHNDIVIRNIAIATDFSPWSDRAMQHALLVARSYAAVVHILHAVRRSEFSFVPDMAFALDELADRDRGDLIRRMQATHSFDQIEYRCWNLHGEVSAFTDFVTDQKIDLLVVGTRGRSGISKMFMGSVAEEITHCVSCPVLTVGPWSRGAAKQLVLKRVLFATDLSPASAVAMPYVIAAARMWGASIDVVHACSGQDSDCQKRMEAQRERLLDLAGSGPPLSIRCHIIPGNPARAVLDFARQNKADLILLGLAVHRSLYGGPPLSHAYEIVRESRCPVLSVRSAPFYAGRE